MRELVGSDKYFYNSMLLEVVICDIFFMSFEDGIKKMRIDILKKLVRYLFFIELY